MRRKLAWTLTAAMVAGALMAAPAFADGVTINVTTTYAGEEVVHYENVRKYSFTFRYKKSFSKAD